MPELRTVRAVVRGRVQGVAYRASCQREARSRGLSGWVRNLADGSVEFLVQGPVTAVEELLTWSRDGPPHAQVHDVAYEDEPCNPNLTGFDIRY